MIDELINIELTKDEFSKVAKKQKRVCSICKRKYTFNPEQGKLWCPYCGPDSVAGTGDIPWNNDRKDRFKRFN